jgi:hypothetical protein
MIVVNTEEGRYEYADTHEEAQFHWEMLEANGYTPVEFTGDI